MSKAKTFVRSRADMATGKPVISGVATVFCRGELEFGIVAPDMERLRQAWAILTSAEMDELIVQNTGGSQ